MEILKLQQSLRSMKQSRSSSSQKAFETDSLLGPTTRGPK
jgi:hypothetical protein